MTGENEIHPTAILEGDVQLGRGNRIGPYCVLYGPLELGDENWLGPHTVVGTPGQDTHDPRYDSSAARIKIGSRNIIREFTAIQKPARGALTSLGDDIYLMQSVHIPHDATIEDKVVMTPMVVLAGTTHVMEGANLGMGVTVHQNSVIGAYAMVATGAPVVKNVPPFATFIPGKPLGVNAYAVKKYGFEDCAPAIEDYVLRGVRPQGTAVDGMIERYEALHAASGRKQYA